MPRIRTLLNITLEIDPEGANAVLVPFTAFLVRAEGVWRYKRAARPRSSYINFNSIETMCVGEGAALVSASA